MNRLTPTKMSAPLTLRPNTKDEDSTIHKVKETVTNSEVILRIVIGVLAFLLIVMVLAFIWRRKKDRRIIVNARYRPGVGGEGKNLFYVVVAAAAVVVVLT